MFCYLLLESADSQTITFIFFYRQLLSTFFFSKVNEMCHMHYTTIEEQLDYNKS